MHPGGDYPFVLRHAWLLFVLVTCVQATIWWKRGQSRIIVDPGLERGFRIFIRIWLVYANGKYGESTDHDHLNRFFIIEEVSNETEFFGDHRIQIEPLGPK